VVGEADREKRDKLWQIKNPWKSSAETKIIVSGRNEISARWGNHEKRKNHSLKKKKRGREDMMMPIVGGKEGGLEKKKR